MAAAALAVIAAADAVKQVFPAQAGLHKKRLAPNRRQPFSLGQQETGLKLGFGLGARAVLARVIAGRTVRCQQILRDCQPPFLAGIDKYADAVGALFFETRELQRGGERDGEIGGLADEYAFVAGPAVVLVAEYALGDEIDRAQGIETGLQRPRLEVVFFARFPVKRNTAVSRHVRLCTQ